MFLFFHNSICAMCTFSSSINNFAHAQTHSRMSSLSGRMNIAWVNIEFFTGCKKIKQRCISFVLGYLRMILWKISTAISIKHRILATFNIKTNSILTACMPLMGNCCFSVKHETLRSNSKGWWLGIRMMHQSGVLSQWVNVMTIQFIMVV
jgi:hypothetical protein